MTAYIVIGCFYLMIGLVFSVAVEIFLDTMKTKPILFERGQFTIRFLLIVTLVVAVCCGVTPWDHINDFEWKATGPNGYSSQGRLIYQPRLDGFGNLNHEWVLEQ